MTLASCATPAHALACRAWRQRRACTHALGGRRRLAATRCCLLRSLERVRSGVCEAIGGATICERVALAGHLTGAVHRRAQATHFIARPHPCVAPPVNPSPSPGAHSA